MRFGSAADREIARSHRVTGVDISPTQIELAREKVPTGQFITEDVLDLEFADETFDAVVSFYAFDHIPRDEHPLLLDRIRHWLRPGGLLLVSIEDADQPGVVGNWLGVDMFFSTRSADDMRRVVEAAGFTIERTAVETQLESQTEIPYVWILARASM